MCFSLLLFIANNTCYYRMWAWYCQQPNTYRPNGSRQIRCKATDMSPHGRRGVLQNLNHTIVDIRFEPMGISVKPIEDNCTVRPNVQFSVCQIE